MNYKRTLCCASLLVRHSSKKYSPYSTKNLTKNSSLLPKLLPQLCCSISSQMNLDFKIVRNYSSYNPDDNYQITDIVYENLSVDNFKELIKSDADAKLIGEILASYEVLKYETGLVPSTISVANMKLLLESPSYRKREKVLNYLFSREMAKYQRKVSHQLPERHPHLEIERAEGKTQIMGVKFDASTGAPLYGEWLNSQFLRFRKSEFNRSFERNLLAGYMFGPKLVIDCDFDVSVTEAKKAVWDIYYSIKLVSQQVNPFDIMLTGPFNEPYKEALQKIMVAYDPGHGYLGTHKTEQSFIDLFPKDKIVYLSPYSFAPLQKYESDKVYVLGGLPEIMDANNHIGTLTKVKSLGIKSYRLPLDDYFVFKVSKKLSLCECVSVLDHLKDNNDILAALKHGVRPGRYKTQEELEAETNKRTERILKRSFRELRRELNTTKFT